MSAFYEEVNEVLVNLDQRVTIVRENQVRMFRKAINDAEPSSQLKSLAIFKGRVAVLIKKLAEMQKLFNDVFKHHNDEIVGYNYDEIMRQFNQFQAWFNEHF